MIPQQVSVRLLLTLILYCTWRLVCCPVVPRQDKKLPLILAYTQYYFKDGFGKKVMKEALEKCPYKCQLSEDPSLYHIADAAVFHMRDFKMNEQLLNNKNPNRLNVFYSVEAPVHEPLANRNISKTFFNVTITMKKDSTIWQPYDLFVPFKDNESDNRDLVWTEQDIDRALRKKEKLALQVVSHCDTHSNRESYARAMRKLIPQNLTLTGRCHDIQDRYVNMQKEIDTHYFYLAFENAVCTDYVTEKFWRLKNLIVPVVLKRSILKGLVEDDYFIAVDDFASPKDLVQKLIALSQNHSEYKKYFEWTKKYKKTSEFNQKEFCKLCEIVTKKERHYIPDIFKWWEGNEKQCEENFGEVLSSCS